MTTTSLPPTDTASVRATGPGQVVPGPGHEALRTALPTTLAVVLLVALLGAGVLALQQVLDFGVWLLAAE